VFAMVAQGELYLRVCEQTTPYQVGQSQRLLSLTKRGRPILLNYYLVDETLWQDRPLLLQHSAQSLREAKQEKERLEETHQMRKLPNMTFQLEKLLREAGVSDPQSLRALGAPSAWYRLRSIRKDLSINVLFALEGAIQGIHAARISYERRQHLRKWAEMLIKRRERTTRNET
jgi:DNA transformation protein and related proteins